MDENENKQIEIDIDNWFAVCGAEENVQVVFPSENFAQWYLEKCGWTGWKIRRVIKNDEGLFLLEEKHCRTENDEN